MSTNEQLADDLATHMAESAKDVSRRYGWPHHDDVDYQFSLGYLTGTLSRILCMLTPAQLEAVACQFNLESKDR